MVSEIFIGECYTMVDMTINDLYAKIKGIHLVPIDSSYTTLYTLSIVTFALGRTV